MRIAILGRGRMGSSIGALLAKGGAEVVTLLKVVAKRVGAAQFPRE